MKKFTPIAMKCTQEDWDSIKSKFSKKQISSINDFDNFGYLVNNHFGLELKLANLSKSNGTGRTSYKKFDANIFLNACGIDYKPFEITRDTVLKYNMKDEFPELFKKQMTLEQIENELGYKIEII